LDDGFQHRRLARDADLVLLDGRCPLENGRRLPAGPLRESASALHRAQGLLLTGLTPTEEISPDTARLLTEHAPGKPFWRSWLVFEGFFPLDARNTEGPFDLGGRPAFAVSGIAHPERFHSLLASLGHGSAGRRVFPDHHRFTPAEVAEIEAEARRGGAVPVTTDKDAVRLEHVANPDAGWLVARVRAEVESRWEDVLSVLLRGRDGWPPAPSGLAGPQPLR
jgi:tetraacyldisaccharide 4'-kinase